jgi:hypothetical protein
MCAVLLPLGVNPIAVHKYIYIYGPTADSNFKFEIVNKQEIQNFAMKMASNITVSQLYLWLFNDLN